MLIKVCGMRDPENIRRVEALGVDMMGFIFYPPSPRCVGETVPSYMPSCCRVGVFVNETVDHVLEKCRLFGLEAVQLHGSEPASFCSEIMAAGFKVIKAFSVASSDDLEHVKEYEGACSMFLFDTRCSSVGGSGVSFDWSILSAYEGNTGFLLSGGLGPGSDLAAFSHPRLMGYDLNSRFETAPGIKDPELLEDFIGRIKSIDYE